MYKSLLVVLCVAFVATGWGRPLVPFVFKFPESWENNDIKTTPSMNDEKRLALETNEVRPSDAVTAATTEAIDESISTESEEAKKEEKPQNDQNVDPKMQTFEIAALINQHEAPTTVIQYVLEFLYGLGHWFYEKLIA